MSREELEDWNRTVVQRAQNTGMNGFPAFFTQRLYALAGGSAIRYVEVSLELTTGRTEDNRADGAVLIFTDDHLLVGVIEGMTVQPEPYGEDDGGKLHVEVLPRKALRSIKSMHSDVVMGHNQAWLVGPSFPRKFPIALHYEGRSEPLYVPGRFASDFDDFYPSLLADLAR